MPVPADVRSEASEAARLLRLWVRIPPGAWMFVCCECCVSSGRGLCDGLITHPEESYWLWRVVMCDQETSKTRRLKPTTGLWKYNQRGCNARKTNKQSLCYNCIQSFDSCNLADTLCHHFMTISTSKGCTCKWINGN